MAIAAHLTDSRSPRPRARGDLRRRGATPRLRAIRAQRMCLMDFLEERFAEPVFPRKNLGHGLPAVGALCQRIAVRGRPPSFTIAG